MADDLLNMVWRELRQEIQGLEQHINRADLRSEQSAYTDSIPAFALADAPLAADGGLGDGTSYITMAWISDGRKPGEGGGAGTGVLAFYSAGGDEWVSVFDQNAVVT